MSKLYLTFILLLFPIKDQGTVSDENKKLEGLMSGFDTGYRELQIPDFSYDYRDNFSVIPAMTILERQEIFFQQLQEKLNAFNQKFLSVNNRLYHDQLLYECGLNLERIALEKKFQSSNKHIPSGGLYSLANGKEWYQYYIHFFTGIHITPTELYGFGLEEIARVKSEIAAIQRQLGFENDSAGFYSHLVSAEFVLTEKNQVITGYEQIKKTVLDNLHNLFHDPVPDVSIMTWAGAGPNTPPGYYDPESDNAYGVGVFHFNFYGGRHNTRMMEWLFLHEAIPGHHYQASIRNKNSQPAYSGLFYYPGNFEGWAAYVEYYGKELGLYTDPYSSLGKWEWDLVRSVRIVIDAGIHYSGWSTAQAVEFWKKNIPNQDEIAEREVNRCMNWPAQALSYKVGAAEIFRMVDTLKKTSPRKFSIRDFHHGYLAMGMVPMEVVKKNIEPFLLPHQTK